MPKTKKSKTEVDLDTGKHQTEGVEEQHAQRAGGESLAETEATPEEKERLRTEGGFICPICGPVPVAPVDDPTSIAPPHCMTCGSALDPNIFVNAPWASQYHGQRDTRRHLEAMKGLRSSFTFEPLEDEDNG